MGIRNVLDFVAMLSGSESAALMGGTSLTVWLPPHATMRRHRQGNEKSMHLHTLNKILATLH